MAGGEAGQSWKQASLEVCFLSIVGLPEVIFGRNNTEVGSTDRGLLELWEPYTYCRGRAVVPKVEDDTRMTGENIMFLTGKE